MQVCFRPSEFASPFRGPSTAARDFAFGREGARNSTGPTDVATMGKTQSKLTPEQLSDLQNNTYCMCRTRRN